MLENLLRGAAVGLGATAIDPLGARVNLYDGDLVGIGPAERQAIPTAAKGILRSAYPDPAASLPVGAYVARGAGLAGGALAGYAGITALAAAAGPVAYALPVLLGGYALARGAGRYLHDIVLGENGPGGRSKGSVPDGFRYGWEYATNALSMPIHVGEMLLTGRGYRNSHYESSVKGAAGGMRRSLRSLAGGLGGLVAGGATLGAMGGLAAVAGGALLGPVGALAGLVAGLVALPAYKLQRDLRRTARGEAAPVQGRPAARPRRPARPAYRHLPTALNVTPLRPASQAA